MVETFTNEYGEQWWFMYDKKNKIGILAGNDDLVLGEIFFVVNGKCPQLVLNQAEKDWIKECWNKYSKPTKKRI